MPNLSDLANLAPKRFGDGRIMNGLMPLRELRKNLFDFPRLMLGVFPLDYAIGGGLPLNVPVQFFGPPSSGKSTTAYLAARALSRTCLNPGCLKPLYLCKCDKPDIKRTFIAQFEGNVIDETWFRILGYNADEHLVLAFPDYAEQGCEMVEAAIRSDDCGLVIVDSIGAMLPKAELEADYEDYAVGIQAKLLTRFIKRISNLLVSELRRGHFVSVLLINQLRASIGGGLFAPTESTAGGHALRHGVRLSVRCAQLSVQGDDKAKKDETNNVLRFSASLVSPATKAQMFIMAPKCEYRLVVGDYRDYRTGGIVDARTTWEKAKELEVAPGWESGKKIIFSDDLVFDKVSDLEDSFRNWEDGRADAVRYIVLEAARRTFFEEIQMRGVRIIHAGRTE